MDIFQFCEEFSTTEHTIAYMRNQGLLRQIPPICGRNGRPRKKDTNGKKTLVAFDNILDQISEYYIVNA